MEFIKKHPHQLFPCIVLILFLILFTILAFGIRDTRLTWFLECAPAIIALPILIFTYKKFPLSNFLYGLIFIHMLILVYGGHYSYANAPLGEWMSEWFGWSRNNYDKIGHFMQGFGPALYAREIMLRTSPLKDGKWVNFNCFSIAMMVSAIYEIIEWLASLSNPEDTEAFLGTQGYIWDTQTDMFMCMIGSILALVLFRKLHDKSMNKVLAWFDAKPAEPKSQEQDA